MECSVINQKLFAKWKLYREAPLFAKCTTRFMYNIDYPNRRTSWKLENWVNVMPFGAILDTAKVLHHVCLYLQTTPPLFKRWSILSDKPSMPISLIFDTDVAWLSRSLRRSTNPKMETASWRLTSSTCLIPSHWPSNIPLGFLYIRGSCHDVLVNNNW